MKSKLLFCFRPDSVDTTDYHKINSTSLLRSGTGGRGTSHWEIQKWGSSKGFGRRTQTTKRNLIRSFSGGFRPAFFDISLKRKSLKGKPSQLTIDSKSIEMSRSDNFSDITNSQSNTTESSASSQTSTSSSNPSPTAKRSIESCSSSKTVYISVNRKKRIVEKVKVDSTSSIRSLAVVTICLGITMVYGRVYGILLTTLCLHFLSCLINEKVPAERTAVTLQEKEFFDRDNRKRVIMQGILERTRLRRTLQT